MGVFECSKRVRFGHCDPAGIVFYPQAVALIHETVEDWFRDALAAPYRELHQERGLGVPTARLEVDFVAPSRLDETLRMTLGVVELGGSSLTLTVAAECDGQRRFVARIRLVMVTLPAVRPVSWPQDLRARIERFVVSNR